MRIAVLLSFITLLSACLSSEPQRGLDAISAIVPEPASPQEMAVSLFERAWEADGAGDATGARRFVTLAFRALDPETVENVTMSRLELLRDLSAFAFTNADLRELSRDIGARYSKAVPMHGQHYRAEGLRVPVLRKPLRKGADGRLEKPDDFDIYREKESSSEPADAIDPEGEPDAIDDDPADESDNAATPPGFTGEFSVEAPASEGLPIAPGLPSTDTSGARAGQPVDSPVQIEKRVLLILLLLDLGQVEDARSLLVDLDRDLDRWGLGESPEASRVRALLDVTGTSTDRTGVADATRGGYDLTPSDGGSESAAGGDSDPRPLLDVRGTRAGRELEKIVANLPGIEHADSVSIGSSLRELGDLAFAAHDYNRAREYYEESRTRSAKTGPADLESLHADMGLSRTFEATGQAAQSTPFLADVAADARSLLPADHPFVLEAQARHVRSVQDALGARATRGLLEAILADQQNALGEDHAATRATRRALAAVSADLGDLRGALGHQWSAYRSSRDSAQRDPTTVGIARLELVAIVNAFYEGSAASDVLRDSSWGIDRPASETSRDLSDMQGEVIRLQLACEFESALALRRDIVRRQGETLAADDLDRIESLHELAALLRVMGRVTEAREVEMEVTVLGLTSPRNLRRAAARGPASSGVSSVAPPVVQLRPAIREPSGRLTVTAEIDDPTGILSVSVTQDGLPRAMSLDETEWVLAAGGTRGSLQIDIDPLADRSVTVISVVAVNLERIESRTAPLVVRLNE